ncbi:hypothetical protein A4G19_06495 [Pasteurellaceae bacterium Macca]|nr:hypothetical protein [Pasteurellaceae bacterium Macca]
MAIGKTIKIYLDDGSVSGIRHAEIVNWTGQAIAIPRIQIKQLAKWNEAQKAGVYFLFGVDENSGDATVYIGESENVLERLNTHIKQKDFWNEAILFTSKDENLTKSHIKYLESNLIKQADEAKRYVLMNRNTSSTVLPRSDQDAMQEFMNNIRLLLGTMGHKVLETYLENKSKITQEKSSPYDNIEFKFIKNGIKAIGIRTNEGFVVKKGSIIHKNISPSLSPNLKKMKEELKTKNIIVPHKDNLFIFKEDYLFLSPAQAINIITGSPISAPQSWKIGTLTLKEFEQNLDKEIENAQY